MKNEPALIDSLREITAVAVAEVDNSGRLLDANAGFLRLLPASFEPGSAQSIGACFLSPTYRDLIEQTAANAEMIYRGLLTIGEPTGRVRSLKGSVSRTGRGMFFLLEHDVEDLELVCAKSLESASELAQAHRELVSIHHRLELTEAESKQSQERLRQSEEKLRRVLDNLPMQTSLLSPEGKILLVNRAALELLGEQLEDVAGRRIWDRPPGFESQPEFKTELRVMCERAARGIPCRTDLSLKMPDTSVKVLDLQIAPICSVSGEVEFLIASTIDITERKRAVEALAEEAIRRRIFIEESSDGIVILDQDGKVYGANPHYAEMLGYSWEELHELHVWDWDVQWTREEVMSKVDQVDERGMRFETRHRRKDGTIFDVEITANGVIHHDRKLIFCVCRDSSDRKRVERALRQWADAFENCAHGIELGDPETNLVLACNPAFSRLLDRPTNDIVGCSVFDMYDLRDHELVRDGIERASQTGQARFEARMRRSDGSIFLVQMDLVCVRDAEGKPLYRVATAQDITERKKVEQEIRELNSSLEGRVAERTARLVAVNAELARAARLKDEFLASMSHELRTPLSGILSMSEALQEGVYGTLNPAQQSAVRDAEECGRHLLTLINDILDVAKIEAGKLELQQSVVAIDQLCQASYRLIKEPAQKKSITVSLNVDQEVENLVADSRRLKQILVNLLSNAVKFTPQGGKIGLDVAGDRQSGQLRFTVWDTGIGIHSENLQRLFQPFVQLDARLARQYEGTGLGLALVKRLVELHGGSMQVESQLGAGSRFTVILPWVQEHATNTGPSEP
ncbi:MAG: PAS domain S-box protein [Isosphaeraceae bacterium]